MKLNDFDIGVIVGRFQVPELHSGHKQLIHEIIRRHHRVIVALGVAPSPCTPSNPMDYVTREKMMLQAFPNIVVIPIQDCITDTMWSRLLDKKTREVYPVGGVCLYGGRDSFVQHYNGVFPAHEFPATDYRAGVDVRKEVGKTTLFSTEARKGMIYTTQNRFPIAYTVVDVAIVNDKKEVLLGKKEGEEKWRFPGGFLEPGESFEETVRREAEEETGCQVDDISYLGSFYIDTWRLRSGPDKMTSAFFIAKYIYGDGHADDDLHCTEWMSINTETQKEINPEHGKMFAALLKRMHTKRRA